MSGPAAAEAAPADRTIHWTMTGSSTLHEAAVALAASSGMSLSGLVDKALRRELAAAGVTVAPRRLGKGGPRKKVMV